MIQDSDGLEDLPVFKVYFSVWFENTYYDFKYNYYRHPLTYVI